ncbi:MAG: hypothetical protein M1834_006365 [Cirrosporium novae-zelandiae]|nr:MAG: hypothetical protein M1834_006365 [Cirrosporium novae-zelandiae]
MPILRHTDEDGRRSYTAPYTSHHPVPNIQRYREQQEKRKIEESGFVKSEDDDNSSPAQPQGNVGNYLNDNEEAKDCQVEQDGEDPKFDDQPETSTQNSHPNEETGNNKGPSATEWVAGELDPKQKRKAMKRYSRDVGGREVTDPVTHLPVIIRDSTSKQLESTPENLPTADSQPWDSTGLSASIKGKDQFNEETQGQETIHMEMEPSFPPPNYDNVQAQLASVYQQALFYGLGCVSVVMIVFASVIGICLGSDAGRYWKVVTTIMVLFVGASLVGFSWAASEWLKNRVNCIWQDELWDASKDRDRQRVKSRGPESTHWLNALVSSIWPLVNPDLFTSLADTLEDVMQASLPKFVRMVSVEDLGQGSEGIQILGVRWLPTGAASRSVTMNGQVQNSKKSSTSNRTALGEGEVGEGSKVLDSQENNDEKKKKSKQQEADKENIAEGMKGEQGDFVNMEIAFAYRSRSVGKSFKAKANNAHLYMAFYLPGGLRVPVWVEMHGLIGTMRIRLQLTPDPPFVALMTLTFLGQPKADISCVPLTQKGLNIMDVPVISSFVQSSIDAALAEYVAPKSLTLDLKDMIVGDDFKKDTVNSGVLLVHIKRARGFKEGDGGLGFVKKGSSDAYVSLEWAKFGKPVFSTRIIQADMEPEWSETTFVLVGPEEVNAEERLRVHLWDSDRTTADDDLGRVELDLKDLIENPESRGEIQKRRDEFMAQDLEEKMPGYIEWSVGYFAKTRIQETQLAQQEEYPDVKSIDQLKKKTEDTSARKLREANIRDESKELDQQTEQDLHERENSLFISSPPSDQYPTGIFSIQIHQITGLEVENIRRNRSTGSHGISEGQPEGDDLPSSYCSIILNHQKIFKTRTKPKNAKPFFNAGTERLIRNWRTTDVFISVRDARVHENDPLLGIVHLPLCKIFNNRSQVNDHFPLVGGLGYGRVRISMVFRSVELRAPKPLLGWDYGTLEITAPIKSDDLPSDFRSCKLKLHTSAGKAKLYTDTDGKGNVHTGQWKPRRERPICLAVRKRYSTCLVLKFHQRSRLGADQVAGFATFWLQDVPDDEVQTLKLEVYAGDEGLERAKANYNVTGAGSPVGHVVVPVKFWHGLSGYHTGLASSDADLKDVMEVLDTAADSQEIEYSLPDDDAGSISSSSSSSSSSTSGKYDTHNQEDGERGPIDQIQDYKDHRRQLHRQHRGLMQWKGVRTAEWVKTKAEHGRNRVLDTFKHHDRGPGIEAEV